MCTSADGARRHLEAMPTLRYTASPLKRMPSTAIAVWLAAASTAGSSVLSFVFPLQVDPSLLAEDGLPPESDCADGAEAVCSEQTTASDSESEQSPAEDEGGWSGFPPVEILARDRSDRWRGAERHHPPVRDSAPSGTTIAPPAAGRPVATDAASAILMRVWVDPNHRAHAPPG